LKGIKNETVSDTVTDTDGLNCTTNTNCSAEGIFLKDFHKSFYGFCENDM